MNIGFDLDGCLVNFTDSYATILTRLTGIQFPRNSSEWPTVWYWDRAAGVSKEAEGAAWAEITSGRTLFWQHLEPLPRSRETLFWLDELRSQGHNIYFITTRPGVLAKLQTERWLNAFGFTNPTVLIARNEAAKGQMAQALGLDVFVDDKPENCQAVVEATKKVDWVDLDIVDTQVHYKYPCRVVLVDAPYNRDFDEPGIERTTDVLELVQRLELAEAA
jgi:5' nucleotidase, deoxy (Pyrimidine), cytosolic type C protein (NT5C)